MFRAYRRGVSMNDRERGEMRRYLATEVMGWEWRGGRSPINEPGCPCYLTKPSYYKAGGPVMNVADWRPDDTATGQIWQVLAAAIDAGWRYGMTCTPHCIYDVYFYHTIVRCWPPKAIALDPCEALCLGVVSAYKCKASQKIKWEIEFGGVLKDGARAIVNLPQEAYLFNMDRCMACVFNINMTCSARKRGLNIIAIREPAAPPCLSEKYRSTFITKDKKFGLHLSVAACGSPFFNWRKVLCITQDGYTWHWPGKCQHKALKGEYNTYGF
jgi:hypothetical protein